MVLATALAPVLITALLRVFVPLQDAAPEAVAVDPDGVQPTLEAIFRPPRLLGQQPRDMALSADGRWITYRWAAEDAEEPERALFLAATDGSETRTLAAHDEDVDVRWTHRGSTLLREHDGWLELLDVSTDEPARPLFEGASLRNVRLLDDSHEAVIQAGGDNQLWLVDLESGNRSMPAGRLHDRSRWFTVLEDIRAVALFARSEPLAETKDDGEPGAEASDEARRLFIVSLDGQDDPRASDLEQVGNLSVSADGQWAASSDWESTVERELVMADYLTEAVTMVPVRSSLAGDDTALIELMLHDLESGTSVPLTLDARDRFHLRGLDWSPTGARLLVHRVSNDYHVRQLLVVDPGTLDVNLVLSERDDAWVGGPTTFAEWSPDGNSVLYTSEQTGFNHLYRVSPEGGPAEALTEGAYEVQSVRLLPDDRNALLVSNDPADFAVRQLRWLDLQSGESHVLTGSDGCVAGTGWSGGLRPRVSRDGSMLVYSWETLGRPGDLHAQALPDGAPVALTDCVPEALDALDLAQPEIVEYASEDGTTVRSFLYMPEPYDPTARYPLVVFVHGAGYLQNVTRSLTYYEVDKLFHHRLARRGYVVLAPDFRHSAGYGRDFRADVHGYMGGKDTDDTVAGVRYLDELGLIDPARVGVYGGSYGGFLTLMCLARYPDEFSAGAALRSVTDWRTYHAGYTNPRLGHPEHDAENYARSSPIDLIADIQDPVLMLHGLKDSNVFAQDSIRFIEELIQLGKEFDAMLYPSQGHGFTDPASWIDEYGRIERFMDRHVRDAPPEPAPVPVPVETSAGTAAEAAGSSADS